jgi:putative DNA primase/helicase
VARVPLSTSPPRLTRVRKVEPRELDDPAELPPLIRDANVPLVVTEGARKADSAVSRGLCAVALVGVSGWHHAPGWDDFRIAGRAIFITFDSDVMTKRPVWREMCRLKKWLESHKATVKLIYLPAGPQGQKVGLDDWIGDQVAQKHDDETIRTNLMALARDEPIPPAPGADGGAGSEQKPGAPEIPENFKLIKDTLYALIERKTKDGETYIANVPVSSRVEVVALTRDESGGEWGRLLHFRDPDGRDHEWAMPTEMLASEGAEYRARLLEQGLTIYPSREARFGLHEYLAECRPSARARAVNRIGWHDGVFVLPDETIGGAESERTLFRSAASVTHAFNRRGSLEDWQREVSRRCVGNSRLILAVSAAFAAALLYLTGDESGGFRLVGASSLGKTTALRVGGSVWGGSPNQAGYLRQWRSTADGIEGVAAIHSDTLLCLDEMSEVNPREAGQIGYMLANSAGKSRAHRDGSARKSYSWRLLFLSSGEITLADKIREDGRQKATAGQGVRILDVPADTESGRGLFDSLHGAKNGQEFADQLKAATQAYYGTAARALLAEIAQQSVHIARNIREHRNDFVAEYCPAEADGQIRRAATRFGLVAAAGELATALGITGWNKDDATRAADACFQAWLRRRGHVGPAEIEDGIASVRRFFALHGESRFSPEVKSLNGHPVINRAGFMKGDVFCVYPQIFRSDVTVGFEWRLLAEALVKRGMLISATAESIRGPDTKTVRVFRFSPAVLTDEDEAAKNRPKKRDSRRHPLSNHGYESRPLCRISAEVY